MLKRYPYTRSCLLLVLSVGLTVAGCACDPRQVAQLVITGLFMASLVVGLLALWPVICRIAALMVADM